MSQSIKITESKLRQIIKNVLIEASKQFDYSDPQLKERCKLLLQEYESLTYENPLGLRNDRVWIKNEPDGLQCLVTTDLHYFDDAINFGSIRVSPSERCSGKGYASEVMKIIINLADKYQVPITLEPKPFGAKQMDVKDLQSWYRRVGFAPDNRQRGGEWTRYPKKT